MRKKYYLSVVLVVILLFGFTISGGWAAAGEGTFTDIQNHWASNQIKSICKQGIMCGVGNGLFAPDRAITRAELAVCLHNIFKLDTGDKEFVKAPSLDDYYNDVKPGKWYSDAILMCAVNDIFTVTNRSFNPGAPVTRIEAAQAIEKCFTAKKIPVMVIMLWPIYKDLTDAETTKIAFASNTGIMKGYNGYFRPHNRMTRAEAACALDRAVSIIKECELAEEHRGNPEP